MQQDFGLLAVFYLKNNEENSARKQWLQKD
jgi:hypothetical protein